MPHVLHFSISSSLHLCLTLALPGPLPFPLFHQFSLTSSLAHLPLTQPTHAIRPLPLWTIPPTISDLWKTLENPFAWALGHRVLRETHENHHARAFEIHHAWALGLWGHLTKPRLNQAQDGILIEHCSALTLPSKSLPRFLFPFGLVGHCFQSTSSRNFRLSLCGWGCAGMGWGYFGSSDR